MAEVNIPTLLKKYVKHMYLEGNTLTLTEGDTSFTDEELAEIQRLEAEVEAEMRAGLTPMDTLK